MSLVAYVLASAAKYNLDPRLLMAVVEQESGGYAWAVRYEDGFFKRYLAGKAASALPGYFPKHITPDTELRLRAFSFGPCQIMGESAREHGFTGESLGELMQPDVNIDLAGLMLRKFLDQHNGDERAALLAWNGGANPAYPDQVLAKKAKVTLGNG